MSSGGTGYAGDPTLPFTGVGLVDPVLVGVGFIVFAVILFVVLAKVSTR